jgi:kynurenine 3-monooxygenase
MPRAFVPLYDLVSFTTVPYAAARERARRQDRLVLAAAAVLALALVAAGAFAVRAVAAGPVAASPAAPATPPARAAP